MSLSDFHTLKFYKSRFLDLAQKRFTTEIKKTLMNQNLQKI